MFGVLMITLLLTITIVGSNMDVILKQGVVYQVRAEITENPAIAESFANVEDFEKFIDEQIQKIALEKIDNQRKEIFPFMNKIIAFLSIFIRYQLFPKPFFSFFFKFFKVIFVENNITCIIF